MANRYWVNGNGNWSDTNHWSATEGGSGGASVPDEDDNVQLGRWTAAPKPTITVDQDVHVKIISLINAVLYLGSYDINVETFDCWTYSGYKSTLYMESAHLIFDHGYGYGVNSYMFFMNNGTNGVTVYEGTSTVTVNSNSTGTKTYLSNVTIPEMTVDSTYGWSLYGTPTFGDLTVNGGSGTAGYNTYDGIEVNFPSGTTTVTGTLTLKGYSVYQRMIVEGGTINAADVDLMDVDFQGLTAIGFSGTRLGDLGENVGITFDDPRDCYWVGNGGNWSDAENHWAITSGGTPSEDYYPLAQDSVYFDANSFNSPGHIVVVNSYHPSNPRFTNMDWTGVTNNPELRFNDDDDGTCIEMYGTKFTLSENMSVSNNMTNGYTGYIKFNNPSEDTDIDTKGISTPIGFYCFLSPTVPVSYNLKSDLVDIDVLYINDGYVTFNTENHNINMAIVDGSGGLQFWNGTFNAGSCTIVLDDTYGNGRAWYIQGTYNAGTSDITLYANSYPTEDGGGSYVQVDGNVFYKFTIEGGAVYDCWWGGAYIADFHIRATSITFYEDDTLSTGSLTVVASSLLNDESDELGQTYIISQTSGYVRGRYLKIRGAIATGGARFYACNSTDLGYNTGWLWECPPEHFYTKEGDPFYSGVYTLGRYSRNYPSVLDLTYPISENTTYGVEVGSIMVVGEDFYVSWKKELDGVVTYGVDKINYNLKYPSAYFETRLMTGHRDVFATFREFILAYTDIPTGTGYTLEYSTDYGETWIMADLIQDVDRKTLNTEEGAESTLLQLRLSVKVSGNDAPVLEAGKVVLT
jgi:hypothetical protein